MDISIKIYNKQGKTLAVEHGIDEVNLVYSGEYEEGDRIGIEIEEAGYLWLQVDDALGSSLVYATGTIDYNIPMGEKRLNLSPKAFAGKKHLLHVRKAYAFEVESYRNLTRNVNDQQGINNLYPHATANVETRGETVFAAVNAVDGVTANGCHGEWPYESWGINRREDACIRIDFGRTVVIDRIVFYGRADFPHDNYWVSATVVFSDGSKEVLQLNKTKYGQMFEIAPREVEWIELRELIQAEGNSPFPALTQLEVWGK